MVEVSDQNVSVPLWYHRKLLLSVAALLPDIMYIDQRHAASSNRKSTHETHARLR